jgi:hypothetical protein
LTVTLASAPLALGVAMVKVPETARTEVNCEEPNSVLSKRMSVP